MKKGTIVAASVLAAVFVALISVGTFFDLSISRALYDGQNGFGRFFTHFAEAPTYFVTALSSLVLYRSIGRKNKLYRYLKPAALVLFLAACYLLRWWFVEEFFSEGGMNYVYAAVFALFLFSLGFLTTRKADREVFVRLLIAATVFLATTIVAQGLTELVKYLWSRQAYSTLACANGLVGTDGYTPWYVVNLGNNNPDFLVYDGEVQDYFYRAFPSAGTASYAALLSLTILPELFPQAKKYEPFFYAVPGALIVLVGLGGIISGREYLTDVVFGAAIGVLASFGLKALLKKLWKKRVPFFQTGEAQDNEVTA
ncbi:MAG: phosphatase PAP2 family protein [Clostridia bacterium]|nr:phosphatase PAP2 family protein [Clostridia bacterium]